MSANDNLGPHLLGRYPSTPDDRDFKAEWFLGTDADLVKQAIAKLQQTTVGFKNKSWSTPPAGSNWGQALALLAQVAGSNPIPPPPPPNPSGDVSYTDAEQLDQGQTGHCVGFGWAQWGNTLPIDDKFTNADGDAIYYECKVIDGEPKAEDGSQVRSGAKAMQNRKRESVYAFASNLADIKTWLQTKGPVVVGTDWYNDMFNPDANGYVVPTGGVAGGHCFALVGDLESEQAFLFQNSWGKSWGLNGYFKMKYTDFQTLFNNQGEACVSVELPLA